MSPYAGEGLGGCSAEHAVTLGVRDSAALLDATAGPGPGDPYAAPPPARPFVQEVATRPGQLRIAWTAAAPNGAPVVPTFLTLIAANTVVNLGGHPIAGRPPRLGEVQTVTYATGQLGERISASDYVRATQAARRLGRQMAAFPADWDVLLTPGLATVPRRSAGSTCCSTTSTSIGDGCLRFHRSRSGSTSRVSLR